MTICLLNPVAGMQQLAEGAPTLQAAGRCKGAPKGSLCAHAELLVFSCRHPAAALVVTTGPTAGTESSEHILPVSICSALISFHTERQQEHKFQHLSMFFSHTLR